MLWYISVILAFQKLRRKDWEIKVSLSYIDPVSKKQNKKNQT